MDIELLPIVDRKLGNYRGTTIHIEIRIRNKEEFVFWLHTICHFHFFNKTKVLEK